VVTVLIAGGGTGGHVFPMLAVGQALTAMDDVEVFYVGTERGIEVRAVPEAGGDLELLPVLPLRGGGLRGFTRGAVQAARAIPLARRLVERRRPDVVLSVGGYAAGPVSLAARTLGIPVAILEPNSHLGLANRVMAPLAARAYTAFPEVERHFRPSVVLRAGVPLRRTFAPTEYTARRDGGLDVLVLGGSLGAKGLNDALPGAVAAAQASGCSIHVVHQTGRDRVAEVRASYAALGLESEATVLPFIDDVAAALASADVVIQRAGASSLAELCAVGRPAILVPYPFAADQHQLKNARSLEREGAAIALVQSDATAERVGGELLALAGDPERCERMARAARSLGRPSAARAIADDLLALARRRRGRA